MSEHDALLAAILGAPDDDTPRLVYADWLQENAGTVKVCGDLPPHNCWKCFVPDGREVRAEFIRVQCQIARTDPHDAVCGKTLQILSHGGGAVLFTPRCRCKPCSLFRREYMLGRRHVVWDWCKGIPAGSVNTYRRGFVEQVRLVSDDFLAHGESILAAHPVTTITLPPFRVEIDAPGKDYGWQIYYYEPGTDRDIASSLGIGPNRADMIARLMQDVRDLQAEFA
ncbi:hypothetical protein VT84_09290 [Gemmata sp. SH-PL17]|uniref:TIGR02996 domain-containing protein n=1 Tax=Gemmata sp. SH-PL17 TaxID=1630693 RepID=UPI00078ED286|nr:TIGR02996 domain-containing protein [Gemmata sp. SH-PL17]AMV24577.1 hypothetical protein VT84_09290 [Gemmata sp. SH-PL17]